MRREGSRGRKTAYLVHTGSLLPVLLLSGLERIVVSIRPALRVNVSLWTLSLLLMLLGLCTGRGGSRSKSLITVEGTLLRLLECTAARGVRNALANTYAGPNILHPNIATVWLVGCLW